MKTMKMLALVLVLFGATTAANSATAFLATDDFVGISFWLISMGVCWQLQHFSLWSKQTLVLSGENQ